MFLVLAGLGTYLCYILPEQQSPLIAKGWLLPLVLLLAFAAIQSVPFPLSWIELVSPARAERVEMVNRLAQTKQNFISLSDQGLFSLSRVVLLVALLVYFLSLRVLMRQDDKVILIIVFIVTAVGVLEALYGLFQFLSPRVGILWLPIKSRAAYGTIIYKNQFSSFMNMCWPLALAGATIYLKNSVGSGRKKSRRQKIREKIRRMGDTEKQVPLYFLATGIMLLAVLFSLSRGGIISMFLVMIFLNVFLPISRKAKFIFLGFFLAFLLAYGSLLGLGTILSRFDSIGLSGSSRIEIYLASLPMLMDHWLSGIGLGSYTLLSPIYLKGFTANLHYDKAHNEFLQLAIELGIPAAVFFFSWLTGAMYVAGKKLMGQRKNNVGQVDSTIIIGGAAFCGLLGFFIHGLADFGWRLPANLFYAVTLAALVCHALDVARRKAK